MAKTTLISAVQKRQLTNGMTLLHQEVAGAPRIAMSIFLPGGNLLESIPGLADLVDRLLLKGTTQRDQEQISIAIDSMTLDLHTDTKRDYSALHATLLEEDLEASLELIADIFFNATFVEFDREKEKVIGEIHMDLDSPKSRSSDLFIRSLFDNTPYGIVSSVILEALPKMTSVDAVQFHYRQIYQPQRAIISVAGDLSMDRVAQALERFFPAGASGASPDTSLDTSAHGTSVQQLQLTAPKYVSFARDDSSQAHIFKGWYTPDLSHPDYYPLVVLNTILGGAGLSSRLFTELRDKQGLAYNVRSNLESYQYKGMFYLYIGTEPSNKDKCLQGFEVECQKLIETPVGADELADAKRNILGRRSVFLETTPQQAHYIGANYTMGRSLEEIQQLPERIEAVTAQDIQHIAETYLTQPAVVSIVGPSGIL